MNLKSLPGVFFLYVRNLTGKQVHVHPGFMSKPPYSGGYGQAASNSPVRRVWLPASTDGEIDHDSQNFDVRGIGGFNGPGRFDRTGSGPADGRENGVFGWANQ